MPLHFPQIFGGNVNTLSVCYVVSYKSLPPKLEYPAKKSDMSQLPTLSLSPSKPENVQVVKIRRKRNGRQDKRELYYPRLTDRFAHEKKGRKEEETEPSYQHTHSNTARAILWTPHPLPRRY